MSLITGSFTAADQVSAQVIVPAGQQVIGTISGTFNAKVVLQQIAGGNNWRNVGTNTDVLTAPASRPGDGPGTYRLACIAYISGTVSYSLDMSSDVPVAGQNALNTPYDSTASGLGAATVQAALDTLATSAAGAAPTSRTISTTAPLSGGGNLSANRTLTTSMATNKLIGRGTAATGVMEEITLGTNLALTGTTLDAAGGTAPFTNTATGLASTTLQAAIAEVAGGATVYSDGYSLNGDGSTDNNTAILAMIAAAEALRVAGRKVKIVLRSVSGGGIFATTGRHSIHGDIDVVFEGYVQLLATGTDDTAPLLTHGISGTRTFGRITGANVKASVANHFYLNPNFVGVRSLCKAHFMDEVRYGENFTIAHQFVSSGADCAYGELTFGEYKVCARGIEVVTGAADTSFASEIVIQGGNFETTTGMNDFGFCAALVMARWWDTGYAGSGVTWNKPSIQITGTPTAWASTTSVIAGKRLYSSKLGAEWLVAVGGTTGSTEPSVIPSGTNVVSLTAITLVAGNAQITVSDSSGLAVGDHVRGTNPSNAFPLDTYIASVDDGTHVTLTKTAATASSTFKATFTKRTSDGATVKLIYLGPYRRPAVWMRDSGANVVLNPARLEGGYGEIVLITGPNRFPESSSSAAAVSVHGHSANSAAVNICREPVWATGETVAVGEMRRRAALNGYYWDVLVGGTTHATTEPTPTESENLVFTDNTVTWICRKLPTTAVSDIGIYTGGIHNFKARVTTPFRDTSPSVAVDNLFMRAIGAAGGWSINGWSRHSTGGVSTSLLSIGDCEMHRAGLILLSASELLGTFFRCDKQKAFRVRKFFKDGYAASRMYVNCLDANGGRLASNSTGSTYHQRVHGNLAVGGGTGTWNESADNIAETVDLLFGDEVKAFTLSWAKGSNPCVFDGVQVSALGFKADSSGIIDSAPTNYNPFSYPTGSRKSLGIPTRGVFRTAGEYIENASVASGQPMGWWISTAGIKAVAWVTSTAYLRGALVAQSSNIYAANGRFTSGTAPSGTSATTPVADGTATSVLDGAANWSYLCAEAAFTADVNAA